MDRLNKASLVCLFLLSAASAWAEPAVEDFSFVQITDIHLSPYLARAEQPPALRGAEALAWIMEEAVGEQNIEAFGINAPPPAFGLATGDLTEYGVIDRTMEAFERVLGALPYPLYVLPGNHDNTWVAMYQVMRERHGGENYSFDRFGVHFVCISSASPQEPVPTIDAKTRAWLRRDLEGLEAGRPVIVALHHPPHSSEFAPAEYDTLIDMLKDYNVALVMYGHGHGVSHRTFDGIDGVMGGSTFGANAGYMHVSVTDGVLRAAYRYHHPPEKAGASEGGWKLLLEKRIVCEAPRRAFRIVRPEASERIGASCEIRCEYEGAAAEASDEWVTFVDGAKVEHEATAGAPGVMRISTEKLTSGRHLLTVLLRRHGAANELRTVSIQTERGSECEVWRREFGAAFKAGAAVVGERLVVAGNDGVVRALERETGRDLWTFETGGEVLATPAYADGALVFGSGDGGVYALDVEGRLIWKHEGKAAVYGEALAEDGVVYIGDNGGRMRALDLKSGAVKWVFERADFSIEARPCVWGDLVVFGAWDGYLYAVRKGDGSLAWKSWGPKSSEGKAARYYAPADCGAAVVGERLLACDRGYLLGAYDREGKLEGTIGEKVAAITAGESGVIVGRKTDDHVCVWNSAGELVWERETPAGRFPAEPTISGERLYVCSNRGLVSELSLADGSLRGQYQATPGFYVMGRVAADESGICYIAGMDGSVTAVRVAR